MSMCLFSGVDLQVSNVRRVMTKVKEVRGHARCADHDVYELLITAKRVVDEGEVEIRLVLYTEGPDADIGLGPLVRAPDVAAVPADELDVPIRRGEETFFADGEVADGEVTGG